MIERKIQVVNKLGLHARAASVFVKTAGRFSSEVIVNNAGKDANGKSIMGVMMLQAACGNEITVTTSGNDEAEAMQAIEEMIANRFGEDE